MNASGVNCVDDGCLKTLGWQKYSHEQYGLKAWGSSGPYQKVYEHFGITGSSEFWGGVFIGA
jgi:transketolase